VSSTSTTAYDRVLVAYGFGFVTPISWSAIGFVWGYCIVWIFIEDWAKLCIYRHLQSSGPRHRRLLDRLHKSGRPFQAKGVSGAILSRS